MAFFVALGAWEDEVLTVAFPEDVPWALLAEFSDQSPLAIIDYDPPDDGPLPGNLHPVAAELDVLLWSSKGYPPALALARNGVRRRHHELLQDGLPVDSDAFQRELATLLRHHLDSQPTAPYRLAESMHGICGYLEQGAYYWLVAFEPQENRVWWVSEDYYVYQDDIEFFAVTPEQLGGLPKPVCQMCD